ncbi:hypothetical protein N8I77_011914 [Diaporthe amygdali]|uniref:Calcineurin-like phosphoesterase domain-containing protein n=1 Tax=Phomopsis amygdali TaxID=1214568 RepID=A0AAD9S537_PHOAM|nr:hypothetical protein N8I77_011914 [Diaporthe amygdali]
MVTPQIKGDYLRMKLQILSDLHLESPKAYGLYEIKPAAPHLALLGDIGCFRTVFHLLGNHEPYGSRWGIAIGKLRAFQEENCRERAQSPDSGLGEYVLLDRDEFHLPNHGLAILGCTLFSDVPATSMNDISFGLNDFFCIDGWMVEQHVQAHRPDVAWLNERDAAIAREHPGRRVVILTHHSPTTDTKTVNPRFSASKISSGFATDLRGEECWRSGNVVF